LTLKPSESPLYVNFTSAGTLGSGAVSNVPTGLTAASFLNRYQYCVPGWSPPTSILTVRSRDALVFILPLKAFRPRSEGFVQPSTLMFSATSTRVQSIARVDVTSPLATPSGNCTAPAAAGTAHALAKISIVAIHRRLTFPLNLPKCRASRTAATAVPTLT
jgi:hypothetical protein